MECRSDLLVQAEGTQERVHIVKLCIAEALQPLRVTGLSREAHCTDLHRKTGQSRGLEWRSLRDRHTDTDKLLTPRKNPHIPVSWVLVT